MARLQAGRVSAGILGVRRQAAAGKVVAGTGVGTGEVGHLLVVETLVEELAQGVRAGAIDQLAPRLLLDQRRDAAAPQVEGDAVKRRVEPYVRHVTVPELHVTFATTGSMPVPLVGRIGLVTAGGHVLGINELAGLTRESRPVPERGQGRAL